MELLRDSRTPHDVASFEYRDFQSSRCEIGSTDEAVVASADDQRVAGFCHWRLSGMVSRMRRAKLRRHTSVSLNGPAV